MEWDGKGGALPERKPKEHGGECDEYDQNGLVGIGGKSP